MNPNHSSFAPKRLPRNILAGVLGQACGLVIAFVTTPILVRGLGEANYGLWNVAMAVGAWVGFANMMFSISAIRFVGQALGRGDDDETRGAHEALRRWSFILGTACSLILIACVPWLAQRALRLEPAQRSWAPTVLLLQAGFVFFQVITAVESGVTAAHQRVDVTQGLRAAGSALQSGGAAVIVLMGHGVVAVAWWVVAMQAVEWMATSWWAQRLQPRTRSARPVDMRRWTTQLFRFGAPLVTGYFAAQLFLPASRILLGTLRPIAEVAHFAIPLTLAINVKALSTHVAGALFPAMAEKAGQGDVPGLRRLYLQGLRWSWLAVVPPAGLAIALGGPFISAWIGPAFGRGVAPVIPTLIVGVNLYYFSSIPELLLQGMGRPAPWAAIIVGAGACNAVAGWWLIRQRGAQGAAEALLIAAFVLTGGLLAWVGWALRVKWQDYISAFDLRVALATAVVAGVLARFVAGRALTVFAVLGCGVAGLGLMALLLPWWLPSDERAWLQRQWRAIRLRR